MAAQEASLFLVGWLRLRRSAPRPVTTGTVSVYWAVQGGVVRYVGITERFAERYLEQLRDKGISVSQIYRLENLARYDARAVEQVLIERFGLEKYGTLLNKINSIATNNPIYTNAVQRGREILKAVGFQGP